MYINVTYVRHHLEHCTQVRSPYKVKDIDILEKVQCCEEESDLLHDPFSHF